MQEPKIQLSNVRKAYGGRTVVDVENLALGRHGIEGLIGPNGAGKSTLMSLITHKVNLDHGSIVFNAGTEGVVLSEWSLDEIARLGVVRTNQIIQDFESLSIVDSILLSLAPPRYEKLYSLFSDEQMQREMRPAVEEYLSYFQFSDPAGHALSAGEKKLLDIIRCLALKPKFLLMDEPTTGLHQDQTDRVLELIRRLTRDDGMSVLIIEHDLDVIWNACEHVHFMAEGQIMTQGSPAEIRGNSTVEIKYLGEPGA
ncbi:MAG TPA: ATP-binding cassette domain-containing protein [Rhodothermales bacterium]|nr:ATP-binding cassette domain-containing protein [Rhodothermales bacterium]